MKILHVVEPFSSGIITFIISLTEALPNHEHGVFHGCRVTEDKLESVRLRFPDYVKFDKWKFAVRQLNPIYDIAAFFELIFHLHFHKYDVIHLHSAKAGFLGRMVGIFIGGRKMVYTPNGAPFLRKDVSTFKRNIYKRLEILASRFSGRVICCGKSESEVYKNIGIKNIYINNGVPLNFSAKPRIPRSKIRILCIGILTFQKNPNMFNAIASQFKDDDRVEFYWVGDGPLRHMINEDNITITGWLDNEGVKSHLSQSHIYLSTSLWEGQPFAVIEAMNYGKCLFLNRCIGNTDLVVEGKNGMIFSSVVEAVKKINHLLDNHQLIEKSGSKSKEMCVKFHDQKKMGRLYENEYEKIFRK